MRSWTRVPRALLTMTALLAAAAAHGQEQCTVVTTFPEGGYKLRIGAREYYAFTEDAVRALRQARAEQDALQAKLAASEKLIAGVEELQRQYQAEGARRREYVQELEDTLAGYRKLLALYRKQKEPWLVVEGGLGLTGEETRPLVMLGLGVRSFRIWGLAQEDNAGAAIGISVPLF